MINTGQSKFLDLPTADIVLKRGRDRSVLNHHPWVFSGAISSIRRGEPMSGDLVNIVSKDGSWLASGYYNPESQISVRIVSWEQQSIDQTFWMGKIEKALTYRLGLQLEPNTNVYRLVNAESDGVPGLIVDKYANWLVVQTLTAAMDKRKELFSTILQKLLVPAGIIDRSDSPIRRKEGIPVESYPGNMEDTPDEIIVMENRYRFIVDLVHGQKTGFYIDQRDNRSRIGELPMIPGKRVLNVFSYTGGFSVYLAGSGPESITHIDSSEKALLLAQRNMALNDFDRNQDEFIAGDAFEVLRSFRDSDRRFDFIILDPPKFAHSRRQVQKACRGYKDINMLALQLLKPEGILATFSCSGLVNRDLFQKVLFGAAEDANRQAQIIGQLGQSMDHPILVTVPESEYLKGFLCRIL